MIKQTLRSAFVVMTAVLLNIMPGNATVWRVNNNANYTQGCLHCFNNLQIAVNDSNVIAGDTIHLEASNLPYTGTGGQPGEVLLNKRLVIIGPGYFLSYNPGLQKNTFSATIERIRFQAGSEYSILKGVRVFRSGGNGNIRIETGEITIENCYIDVFIDFRNAININNVYIKKCYINGSITGSNATASTSDLFINNCFIGNSVNLINNGSLSYAGEISHCVVVAAGGSIAPVQIKSTVEFYNNIITRNAGGLPATLINQNDNGLNIHDNIFIDVLPNFTVGSNNSLLNASYVFVSGGSQDSLLNVNPVVSCPECYTGFPSGTETMGIFGGSDPYKLSGIPNIPSIYQLQSPLNIIQGVPVQVNISTRSND